MPRPKTIVVEVEEVLTPTRPTAKELKKIADDFRLPHSTRADARYKLARWYGFMPQRTDT